ncbi:MAG: ribonuclease HII [Desulfosalsimonadaceae bacterium]
MMPPHNLWSYEDQAGKRGFQRIAGVDEVGRGPLAGPVVAAAAVLPRDLPEAGIADSKQLSEKKRERLYEFVYRHALSVGVGIVDPPEIDRINILQAACAAMAMAVSNLAPAPDFVLVDGNRLPPLDMPAEAVPGGDRLSLSVAAASIVAKVTRDRMMGVYARDYPEYGFTSNKGYPTRTHRDALAAHGATPIHRLSFKGVRCLFRAES